MSWVLERLNHYQPDLVVLARHADVTTEIVQAFRYRIINIHPRCCRTAGRRFISRPGKAVCITGHRSFRPEALDEGPIILQDVFHMG
jgi:formyltetrahydrofolate hydrolase